MTSDTTTAAALTGGHHQLELRLPYRAPCAFADLVGFLGDRAIAGVEEVVDGVYGRVLRLPHGTGVVWLGPGGSGPDGPWLGCRLRLDDRRDLAPARRMCRRLLDLDAEPAVVDAVLGADPALAPLVAARPGTRAPGHVDGHELAVRTVLGQQISVAAARRKAGQLVALCGRPLDHPVGGLTTAFPSPDELAGADLATIGMPGARKRTLTAVATAVAGGDLVLDGDVDRDEAEARLLALPGIGPWTASYIRMRALGDPDVALTTDLGVRHALDRLAAATAARPDPERWRPFRSYAVQHLWASLVPQPREEDRT